MPLTGGQSAAEEPLSTTEQPEPEAHRCFAVSRGVAALPPEPAMVATRSPELLARIEEKRAQAARARRVGTAPPPAELCESNPSPPDACVRCGPEEQEAFAPPPLVSPGVPCLCLAPMPCKCKVCEDEHGMWPSDR